MPGSSRRWSRRKILIAVLASIGVLAMVGTTVASMVVPFLMGDDDAAGPRTVVATPTSTTPAVTMKPLIVRPVLEQPLQARAEDCVPAPPPAPDAPLRTCDVEKAAVYLLGPVGLELNLTAATAAKLPLSEFSSVQMAMDPASGVAFAKYTAANVGKQVAFVRDGVVLAAPNIIEPINGQSLQISGELSGATADTIARMLRDGS